MIRLLGSSVRCSPGEFEEKQVDEAPKQRTSSAFSALGSMVNYERRLRVSAPGLLGDLLRPCIMRVPHYALLRETILSIALSTISSLTSPQFVLACFTNAVC